MSNFRSRKDVPLWVSPTHGPQWIERKYARLGPIDPDRRNPQAQRAREWIAQYERELAAEAIEWTDDELTELLLVAEGKRDVSECSFWDRSEAGFDFEAEGSQCVSAGSDCRQG